MNDLLLFLAFRVLNFYFAGLAHNLIFFFFNQLLPFILVNLIINPLFYELLVNLINMLVYFDFFDFIDELMQNIFQPGTLSHILLPNSAHHQSCLYFFDSVILEEVNNHKDHFNDHNNREICGEDPDDIVLNVEVVCEAYE